MKGKDTITCKKHIPHNCLALVCIAWNHIIPVMIEKYIGIIVKITQQYCYYLTFFWNKVNIRNKV